jgi:hypothetical protein
MNTTLTTHPAYDQARYEKITGTYNKKRLCASHPVDAHVQHTTHKGQLSSFIATQRIENKKHKTQK